MHGRWSFAAVAIGVLASGCAASPARGPAPPGPVLIEARPRIVTAEEVTTEAELQARAEGALLSQNWHVAADTYLLLFRADPGGPRAAEYLFNRGLALEGLEDRAGARDVFLDLSNRFPGGPKARSALVRAASISATRSGRATSMIAVSLGSASAPTVRA